MAMVLDDERALPSPARTKTGCQHCRLRHLRCDENRPSCSRCEKAGIECVRGYNIRFRHGANPSVSDDGVKATEDVFSEAQIWVQTAGNLTFLDETPELINIYDHEDLYQKKDLQRPRPPTAKTSATSSASPAVAAPGIGVHEQSPGLPSYGVASNYPSPLEKSVAASTGPGDATSPAKRRRLTQETNASGSAQPSSAFGSPSSWHATSFGEPSSAVVGDDSPDGHPLEGLFTHSDLAAGYQFTSAPSVLDLGSSLSRTYLNTPIWPLRNREEARLMQNYTERIARNFDLTDPLCHFRKVVPQRAASCPPLLNAIFALSARHLSRVSDYDPLVSNKYHHECLKHLIPMLDDPAVILDENLLASSIILRHLEEFEIPVSGQPESDLSSHLLGAHTFIAAQERAALAGGLRQAAFWTGLRQEIYVAFVNQRSVIPTLEHCNIDRSFEAADDFTWACRAVVLTADVMRYCFSDGDHSHAQYAFLVENVQKWWQTKPATYNPIYYGPPEGERVFAEAIFVTDEIPTGLQHHHLSCILLAAHNPRIPRLGPRRAAALKAMDDEIRFHVRELCAIATSNPSLAPSFSYAAMGITMCGDKFDDRREQEALIGLLDYMDRMHGTPTGVAQGNLKEAWGWANT